MMKKKLFIALTLLLSCTMVSKASYADDWNIPSADAKGRVGALMPYTRYDWNGIEWIAGCLCK